MKILAILGPTASGKTSVAIDLAKKYDFEIISVDSAMIYKGLDIGTGKPNKEILKKYPHRLVDILDPSESYSVGNFCIDVKNHINDIHSRGKTPLLVGGTMMYFNILYNGIGDIPESSIEIRKELEEELKLKGLSFLYDKLEKIDKITHDILEPNDTQRILRALEVYYISNKPISRFKINSKPILDLYDPRYKITNIVMHPISRAIVHENIAKRFHEMLTLGFEDEVLKLYKRKDLTIEHSSMRCVGYKQMWQYFNNELSYDQMIEKSIAATRQLAKRQFTWIRKIDKKISPHFLDSNDPYLIEKILKLTC